ncbi:MULTISPECIES: hypothetical protein [Enterobacteriaceae]|jgi:hypothetical protein|uniref:Inner membrane protein n=1 Tax=Klebsiella quasipneumoniae TaxID=1463165 RepID=A0ABD7NAA0_9ENTR|nr:MULTISPECIES: hypothetical protein [Enterobacteriaceae]MBK4462749.1 hypothetical protein [Enterobacter cloacae]EKY0716987.1 hypothetical protein [Klebsiella pneumoniae]EKZ6666028.1 hypothetical protein [Klebsiella pneumoniae]ELA1635538.1 hypothetical protein [Klebsiella pneumoniae]MBE1965873.1 hypothetical protein [Klebsiella pneumoniae]
MRNDTFNALILRLGDRMLRQAGWPDVIDMAPVAPETVPGWLVACGSLSGAEILTLTEQLCQPLTYGRAALLLASARRLTGTPARLHLFPVQAYPHPERLADCQVIRLPYAQEWLTAAECDDLLAFLKASLTQITEIVRLDAHRLAAALKPSVTPRLMDRRFGDWRVLADEYEHENWLDENDTDVLDAVLDAVLVRGARFCPILLTVVNERREEIEAAGVITDMLRFPGDPARRWLDRRVLREVVSEARATPAQT